MSELTKNQLKQDNQNSFPNNNTGYITPAILRDFNINMIDSLVDEVSYTADSSSFNARINALDPSGSAASLLAIEQATGSLNAYTASQNLFNSSATASIVALQSFSSSLDATFATDAQLTALSTSIAVTDLAQSQSIAALQQFSSSLDATFATDAQLSASVAALSSSVAVTDNAQSASIAALQSFSSSLDATFATDAQLSASVSSLSSSVAVTDLAQSASIAALQQFSSSLDATFATDAQLSASVAALSSSVAVTTNSLSSSIGNLSSSIAVTDLAQSASIAALQQFSSSLDATFATDAQLSASASTLQNNINSKLDSASFNSYTQSNDTKWNNLGNQSGSFITESETGSMSVASASFATTASFALNVVGFDSSSLVTTASFNAYTSSNDSKVNSLISKTGSYATTGSNTFQGQQFFQESVYVASDRTLFTNKIQENSGGTIFFQGDLQAVNPATHTVNANLIGTASFATTASFALNATSVDTSSLVSTSSFNSYTASNDSKVNSLISATGSYVTEAESGSFATTGSNTFIGEQKITGSVRVDGDLILDDDGGTTSLLLNQKFTTEFLGSNLRWQEAAKKVTWEVFESEVQLALAAYSASYDNGFIVDVKSDGTTLSDYNTSFVNQPWLKVPVNGNNNPPVQFPRGAGITGSLSVSGSATFGGQTVFNGVSVFNTPLTASAARINGNIVATGDITASNITATSASFQYVQTIYETSSIIFSSGSNQFGDELSDVQTLSGSVKVQGELLVNGVPVQTSSFDASGYLLTSSFNSYTASASTAVSGAINSATQSLSSSIAVTTNGLDLEVNQKLDSSSFNSYTQSNDSKVNSLIAATSSYAISSSVATITGNSLVTASIAGDTITFTKGNGSTFPIVIPTLSGSVPSGTVSSSAQITEFGFATTSSVSESVSALNAATSSYITSAQTSSMTVLSASFAETASFLLGSVASASFATTASFAFTASEARNVVLIARNQNASTLPAGTLVHIVDAVGDNPIFNTASFDTETLSANTLGMLITPAASGADVEVLVNGIVTGVNTDPALGYVAGDILYLSSSGQFTRVQPQAPKQIVTIGQVLRAQQNNGSVYVNITNGWELDELHNVAINGVADGDLLVYRSAESLWTNSSSIELGLATTGSNSFVGNENITGSLLVRSGSIYSISNNTTLNPQLYYTASEAGFANIVRGFDDDLDAGGNGSNQANFTARPRVTGSNNILTALQVIPTTFPGGTAEMTGYISGSGNIILSGRGGMYLNSGSQLLPKTSANQIGLNARIMMNFTTSSLSGGHPIVNQNILQGAAIVLNHPSGSINAVGNLQMGGTISSSQAFVTNVRPTIVTNNLLGNTITLRHISSSIAFGQNYTNAPLTIENHVSSSGISNNNISVNANTILGGSGNTGHNIYVSGSQNSNAARNIIDNIIGGKNIIVSSSFVSSSNSNLLASLIYGQNLIVSGNHGTAGGSTFVGRNNDSASGLANAQDIVFAVGTGTSTAARKTGLWIDSGSLTTINGGLYVTQSQVTLTNSGSTPNTLALAVRSGSVEVTSPQGNGYFYTNLPLTSSNLRINGDGIIADLYVSGVFAGNSTLNVAGNSYFTGSVNVNNNVSITGSLDVNGTNIINTLNGLSSQTSSYVTESETSSFATTSSNNFIGDQKITGSVRVDGDLIVDDDGGTTSFLLNQRFSTEFLGSQMRWQEANKKFTWDAYESIVDINLSAYSSSYDNGLAINLREDGTTFSDYNTSFVTQSWLRIPVNNNNNPAPQFPRGAGITGSLLASGSTTITGSVVGNVNALSISSNTASLNLNNGNFFTLQLVSGSSTHITPTNIKPGQTISLRLNTTGSGTVTFDSSIKQASGSAYVPTTTTGVDVITLISFDTQSLYISNLKNFN